MALLSNGRLIGGGNRDSIKGINTKGLTLDDSICFRTTRSCATVRCIEHLNSNRLLNYSSGTAILDSSSLNVSLRNCPFSGLTVKCPQLTANTQRLCRLLFSTSTRGGQPLLQL